jgi:hypothetical protein
MFTTRTLDFGDENDLRRLLQLEHAESPEAEMEALAG